MCSYRDFYEVRFRERWDGYNHRRSYKNILGGARALVKKFTKNNVEGKSWRIEKKDHQNSNLKRNLPPNWPVRSAKENFRLFSNFWVEFFSSVQKKYNLNKKFCFKLNWRAKKFFYNFFKFSSTLGCFSPLNPPLLI